MWAERAISSYLSFFSKCCSCGDASGGLPEEHQLLATSSSSPDMDEEQQNLVFEASLRLLASHGRSLPMAKASYSDGFASARASDRSSRSPGPAAGWGPNVLASARGSNSGPAAVWNKSGSISARTSYATGSSERSTERQSTTSEERQRDKELMQAMVREFAKAVVQGQTCLWLSTVGGASSTRTAHYALDKALRTFSVKPQEGETVVIPLVDISEIRKDVTETPYASFGKLPLPHEVSRDDMERRLVCVSYALEQAKASAGTTHILLLLPDQHERDRFYTCMKILRWALDCKRERA